MKTITMYELLGMVKDGKAPKKIKYGNKIYTLSNLVTDYMNEDGDYLTDEFDDFVILYNEVEIIEETPKISKLYINNELQYDLEEKKIPEKLTDILKVDDLIPPVDENMYKIWKQTIKNHNKINEICDYLKSKGE